MHQPQTWQEISRKISEIIFLRSEGWQELLISRRPLFPKLIEGGIFEFLIRRWLALVYPAGSGKDWLWRFEGRRETVGGIISG